MLTTQTTQKTQPARTTLTLKTPTAARPVVFLFPGQGAQHAGMAAGLYGREETFTEAAEEVLQLLGKEGQAIRDDWLSPWQRVDIDDVRRAQPLLFTVEYALARMLLESGVRPAALLGHSAGELVAATLAGVFTLDEAAAVLRDRVAGAAALPPGGMIAVAAAPGALEPYLPDGVTVGAVNAATQTMLAGPDIPLRNVERRLRAAGFVLRRVPATAPFHSPAMGPAAAAAEQGLARIRLRAPAADPVLYSAYTGGRLGAEDACSPAFWARHLTDTVYFGPTLDRLLLTEGQVLLVETGPGQTLTILARRHRAVRSGLSSVVPMLPAGPKGPNDRLTAFAAVAAIEAEGHALRPGTLRALSRSLGVPRPPQTAARLDRGRVPLSA